MLLPKKLLIFSQNFQLIPGTLPDKISRLATPSGIERTVAAIIPIITEIIILAIIII